MTRLLRALCAACSIFAASAFGAAAAGVAIEVKIAVAEAPAKWVAPRCGVGETEAEAASKKYPLAAGAVPLKDGAYKGVVIAKGSVPDAVAPTIRYWRCVLRLATLEGKIAEPKSPRATRPFPMRSGVFCIKGRFDQPEQSETC